MMIGDFTSGPYTATLQSGINDDWQETGNPIFQASLLGFGFPVRPLGISGRCMLAMETFQ